MELYPMAMEHQQMKFSFIEGFILNEREKWKLNVAKTMKERSEKEVKKKISAESEEKTFRAWEIKYWIIQTKSSSLFSGHQLFTRICHLSDCFIFWNCFHFARTSYPHCNVIRCAFFSLFSRSYYEFPFIRIFAALKFRSPVTLLLISDFTINQDTQYVICNVP